MGTFERIRQLSPYFFGIFAVLLIAYFVFTSGGEDIAKQQVNPQTASIAKVNGEEISRAEFERRVNEIMEQRRQQLQQQGEEAEVDLAEIRSQVWNEMVDMTLIRQLAREAGFEVTDEEILDIMVENPPEQIKQAFTDTAGFRRQMYLELISDPNKMVNFMGQDPSQIPQQQRTEAVQRFRESLIEITKQIRSQKYSQKLATTIESSIGVISLQYAKQKYINENGTANVDYIAYLIGNIPNEKVEVTESEIDDYYKEHKKYYKQDAQRKIKYINFKLQPSEDDSARAQRNFELMNEAFEKGETIEERDSIFDKQIEKFNGQTYDFQMLKDIEDFKKTYILPLDKREVAGPIKQSDGYYYFRLDAKRKNQKVKLSHILISSNNNPDSSKAEAEKILGRIEAGEEFSELAKEYSQDRSGQTGGNLGYITKGEVAEPYIPLANAAVAADSGEVVGPVKTEFGYHIVKVTDGNITEIAFSEIHIRPRMTTITKNLIKADAYSFYKQVQEGENFDTLAKKIDKRVVPTGFFGSDRPILGSRYLADLVFEADEGDILEPMELDNYGIVVPYIEEVREEGIKPLEAVKSQIERKLTQIKKLDMLKENAEKAYQKAKSAGSLEAVAANDPNLEVKNAPEMKNNGMVPGLGQESAFTAYAFKAPVGKIRGPLRGERGYYIMKVNSRNIPDSAEIAKKLPEYKKQLSQSEQRGYLQWFRSYKENAKIVDNRSKFYREY